MGERVSINEVYISPNFNSDLRLCEIVILANSAAKAKRQRVNINIACKVHVPEGQTKPLASMRIYI